MKISGTLRRTLAAAITTAGLAYPACAAVCPKGIGGCTSPGRCFLFVDSDGNSLCDYTSRTGTSGTTSSATVAPTQVSGSSGSTAAPATDTAAAAVQDPSAGSLSGTAGFAIPIFEAALFLILTGVLYAIIRARVPGMQEKGRLPVLVLSSFFALGISLVVTCILAGGTVSGTVFALVYMAAGSVFIGYLWYSGLMTRRIVLLAALQSTVCGFVFVAPIMPQEIGGLVNAATGTSALTLGVVVICAVIALSLVVSRAFCGSICPVGSLQELAYAVPVKKYIIRHPGILELVRFALFVVIIVSAVMLVDLTAYMGLYDLFSLTVSAVLVVALGLLLLSVFVYRPVCRILCPFGVIFSFVAEFSWLRLRRAKTCVNCKKCEAACPACAAGRFNSRRECYLCGRCTDACPETGTLRYGPPQAQSREKSP